MANKRFLYILSGNISTTPRAVQSAKTAIEAGNQVDFMMVNRLEQWKKLDGDILSGLSDRYSYVRFRRDEGVFIWFLVSVIQKMAQWISLLGLKNVHINAFASSKINVSYYFALKQLHQKYDLIIGHSGMLYPAYLLSRRTHVPFSFDIEDYHPCEHITDQPQERERSRRAYLFTRLLPLSNYFTYASPLIGERTLLLLREANVKIPDHLLINNTFVREDFEFSENNTPKVQFIWFSQTISYGRGLEWILPVLQRVKDKVSLTLIGNLDSNYEHFLETYKDVVVLKGAMPQALLHEAVCKYDIGLATEVETDENRSMCLSNKIFTYILSGVYVLATDTKAQQRLLTENQLFGRIVSQSEQGISDGVAYILEHIDEIRKGKPRRFEDAAALSWNIEREKLLLAWNRLI